MSKVGFLKVSLLIFFAALFFNAAAPVCAEVFRTHKTLCIQVPATGISETRKCGINDSIAAVLPEDLTFIQGIEIQVKVPQIVAKFRNTVIYSIYNDIAPTPSENRIDYSGTELYSGAYQGQLVWSILIPLARGNTIKQSPYADKTLIPDTKGGFVFLRNQLAMKGVPETVMSAEFEVSVKPILNGLGGLRITAPADSGEYTVIVDEKPASPAESGVFILKPGRHNISIASENFRNEVRTVIIDEAQITDLSVELTSVKPSVKIHAPEGTKFFVDDLETDIKSPDMSPGAHLLRFEIGGYEVTKNVTIQNGKSYTISVSVDAAIKEE